MEIWDIYNKSREKTGKTIQRGDQLQEGEFHLVVHIWIQNSRGEVLIQKRAENLAWKPGIWATTGGSAISGEESLEAAIRETLEELGISLKTDELRLVFTQIRTNDITDIWLAQRNLPISAFQFPEEDVSEIKWETAENIQRMIDSGDFVDYGLDYFNNLSLQSGTSY